jgi:hypothetical protein
MNGRYDTLALLRTAALVAAVVVPTMTTLPAGAFPRPEPPQVRSQQLQQSLVPRRPTVQRPAYQDVVDDVERGIASGSVADFSAHFPSQVSISLRGEGSGTYSSNQAYYFLDQFFRLHRFTGCKFTTVGESGGIPFATGSASFTLKGGRETAQVYLSLARSGDRWVISQINIY